MVKLVKQLTGSNFPFLFNTNDFLATFWGWLGASSSSRTGMTQESGSASKICVHSSRVFVENLADSFDFNASVSPNWGSSSEIRPRMTALFSYYTPSTTFLILSSFQGKGYSLLLPMNDRTRLFSPYLVIYVTKELQVLAKLKNQSCWTF